MTAGCVFSVLIAQIFVQTPLVLLLVLALLIFFAFLLLARGQAVPVASILLITTSVVPLVAVSSLDLAYGLVYTLIAGSILAALLVLLAYAIFPSRDDASEAAKRPVEEGSPIAAALANAAALVSLVILFMFSGSPVSVIVIMTAITILQQPASAGHGTAYAFIMGNVAGGVAATVAYLLVSVFPVGGRALAGRAVLWTGLWRQDRGRSRCDAGIRRRAGHISYRARPRPHTARPTAGRSSFLGSSTSSSPPPTRSASRAFCGRCFEHRNHITDDRRKFAIGERQTSEFGASVAAYDLDQLPDLD